ncbi:hypothetical protein MRB53_034584 [Persea americana]|uniref:Uncharacterized protein n=1 Tax=Persea americana TaxID=3435 RepID=A0ACC2K2P5_PERAE|nr:hypothetical protein MRB53_034584 [Persea americana]
MKVRGAAGWPRHHAPQQAAAARSELAAALQQLAARDGMLLQQLWARSYCQVGQGFASGWRGEGIMGVGIRWENGGR